MNRKYLLGVWMSLTVSFIASSSAQVTQTSVAVFPKKNDSSSREVLSEMVAPIKSKDDLIRYLKMVPPKSNALYLLSSAARERFIASVSFNQDGVTGFDTTDLQRELSEVQIAKILALFGSQNLARVIVADKSSRASRLADRKNFCFDTDPERPQFSPGNCDPGDGTWKEPFHPHPEPKIPLPIPPSPDPIPGSIHPVPLPSGDIYHMECSVGGSTCIPHNNWICKARC